MGEHARDECGVFDIRINRDGLWFYHGTPIGRRELVKLFASVLRRDAEGRFLLETPAERGVIEVEDTPFVAVELNVEGTGRSQRLIFRTNIDENVVVDALHPLHGFEQVGFVGRRRLHWRRRSLPAARETPGREKRERDECRVVE